MFVFCSIQYFRCSRRAALTLLLVLLAALPGHAEKMPAEVSVCFVPGEPCASQIVAAIGAARSEVRVQAYGFSAAPILSALAEARARGVDVAVILDRSDERRLCEHDAALLAAGVPMWIDHLPGIAHNKVIVIDRRIVIGGSYNYTASVERRNAENVTFIDSEAVAARFLANWARRQAAAEFLGSDVACAS
jgi:phosphatidylserine/phosphatidylglycerophosphate/cardiolipin synthase-like enzyme